MLYKATVSFSGVISMSRGEVREISDQTLVKDLLQAGYILELKADEQPKEAEEKPKKTTKKPATKRKGKDNED